MTVPRRLQLLAGGLWAASWFLPAAETSGDLLAGVVSGWQAFLFAISPVLGNDLDAGVPLTIWMVTSALTNALVVPAVRASLRRVERSTRLAGWALAAAAAINGVWFLLPEMRPELGAGYFVWAGSFVAGAAGFLIEARQMQRADRH